MSSKFWYLTGESFKKKVRSKWFLIANIVLFVALLAVVNIDRIISYFGGDFSSQKEVMVLDQTGYAYETFRSNLDNIQSLLDIDYDMNITKREENVDALKEEISGTDTILIVLSSSDTAYLKASVISDSYIDTSFYQYLYQALSTTKMDIALSISNIDLEEYQKVTSDMEVERILLNEAQTSEEELMNTVMGVVFPTVILPFFILVIFLVQMIGSEINEEKASRSMEIIISNVSPKVHFFSKLVSSNAFVLLQAFLLIVYGAIALFLRSITGGSSLTGVVGESMGSIFTTLSDAGILSRLGIIIPLTLILLVLSFLAYSLVAGVLASMTVSMEDFQQIQTPIILICLLSYYLAIMSGMFQGSIVIRVLSYVPFLSCLLSPALLITNQITILDTVISIVILAIFNWAFLKYGLKIYKVGILNYSTDKMWHKIFRAAKKKGSL